MTEDEMVVVLVHKDFTESEAVAVAARGYLSPIETRKFLGEDVTAAVINGYKRRGILVADTDPATNAPYVPARFPFDMVNDAAIHRATKASKIRGRDMESEDWKWSPEATVVADGKSAVTTVEVQSATGDVDQDGPVMVVGHSPTTSDRKVPQLDPMVWEEAEEIQVDLQGSS